MNPDRFYVYCYAEPGAEHPFYIGKGHGKRAYAHLKPSVRVKRCRLYNKVQKMLREGVKPRVEFLAVALFESEAFSLEHRLIRHWGRLDRGTGCLLNATDGGEGTSGLLRSPEHLAKIAVARRGYRHSPETLAKMAAARVGRKLSPEHAAKVAAARLGKKESAEKNAKRKALFREKNGRAVHRTDPVTGEVVTYAAIVDVAKDGFCRPSVSRVCSGGKKTHRGFLWSYCDPIEPTLPGGSRPCRASCSPSPC